MLLALREGLGFGTASTEAATMVSLADSPAATLRKPLAASYK